MGAVDISEKQVREIEASLFIDAMNNLDARFKELIESYNEYAAECRTLGRLVIGPEHSQLASQLACFQSAVAWNVGVTIAMEEVVSVLHKNVEEMDKQYDAEARAMHKDEGETSMAFAMDSANAESE